MHNESSMGQPPSLQGFCRRYSQKKNQTSLCSQQGQIAELSEERKIKSNNDCPIFQIFKEEAFTSSTTFPKKNLSLNI